MKSTAQIILIALGLGTSALYLTAQTERPALGGERPPRREGGPPGAPSRGEMPRPVMHPLETALDADGDGTISSAEIANAPAALKKLDKNGDGSLSPDEFRPMRRGPGGPGGRGPGGPRDGADGSQRPPRPPRGPEGQ
jgi:hypothetical protein